MRRNSYLEFFFISSFRPRIGSCFTDPGVRKDLHGYLAATANHLGSPAICVGGVADHVHVVCSLGRTLSVATVVAKLKVSSNLAVRERYWSQFSWQNGYAAFSLNAYNFVKL